MNILFLAVLPVLLFVTPQALMSINTTFAAHCSRKDCTSKSLLAKDHSHFSVISRKDSLFFFFATAEKVLVPPNSPPAFVQAYIMTPDNRRINGQKIDVTNPIREFHITVPPPLLFGMYTVVIKNISVPGAMHNYILPNVIVKNSLNNRQSTISVTSTRAVPANPGDTIQGYFFPFHTFVDD